CLEWHRPLFRLQLGHCQARRRRTDANRRILLYTRAGFDEFRPHLSRRLQRHPCRLSFDNPCQRHLFQIPETRSSAGRQLSDFRRTVLRPWKQKQKNERSNLLSPKRSRCTKVCSVFTLPFLLYPVTRELPNAHRPCRKIAVGSNRDQIAATNN